MTNIKFNDFLKRELKDPDFKAGFERYNNQLASAVAVMQARESAGLTQQELADRAAVLQSTIVRIEQGANTSIDTMSKIAWALGKHLEVKFT